MEANFVLLTLPKAQLSPCPACIIHLSSFFDQIRFYSFTLSLSLSLSLCIERMKMQSHVRQPHSQLINPRYFLSFLCSLFPSNKWHCLFHNRNVTTPSNQSLLLDVFLLRHPLYIPFPTVTFHFPFKWVVTGSRNKPASYACSETEREIKIARRRERRGEIEFVSVLE
jgi:hypothetical protein